MNLKGDRREVLILMASREHVPLYLIMRLWQANPNARISELRDMGYDIPAPKMGKNAAGNMMSTYSMPAFDTKHGKGRYSAKVDLRRVEVLSE